MRSLLCVALVACAEAPTSDLPVLPDTDDTTPAGPPDTLAVDNAQMALLRVRDDGTVAWTAQTGLLPRDLSVSGDRVLVSSATGGTWHDLETGEQKGELSGLLNVQSAQVLPSGDLRFAAQQGDDAVVVDVSDDGAELGRIVIPGVHDLRLLRTLSNGNLLLTSSDPFRAIETDAGGQEVWTAPLPGKGYLAVRADDGTTWATTGDDLQIVHLDADGALLGARGGQSDLGLAWLSGFDLDPATGELCAANWFGHDTTATGPHIVCFDEANEPIWRWDDHEAATQITHVLRLR